MPELKKPRKRQRAHQTYQYHKNAISVSVYDPTGATIPVEIREQLAQSVFDVAVAHKLLINIADE